MDRSQAKGYMDWLEYLTWGTTGWSRGTASDSPVGEAVEHDLATVAKFQPPDGRLHLAFEGDVAIGTACMQQVGPAPAKSSACTFNRRTATLGWVAYC